MVWKMLIHNSWLNLSSLNIIKRCLGGQPLEFFMKGRLCYHKIIYSQKVYILQFSSKPLLVGTQIKALSVQIPKMILLTSAVCFVFKILAFLWKTSITRKLVFSPLTLNNFVFWIPAIPNLTIFGFPTLRALKWGATRWVFDFFELSYEHLKNFECRLFLIYRPYLEKFIYAYG